MFSSRAFGPVLLEAVFLFRRDKPDFPNVSEIFPKMLGYAAGRRIDQSSSDCPEEKKVKGLCRVEMFNPKRSQGMEPLQAGIVH